ncbi:MAG: pirin family protein [Burkholderiales bacterium]|jgi:redox-sensitive bicupin YhaK (pirin superfamily)|nr:pirin family protein [Burkholderiales bacterium]
MITLRKSQERGFADHGWLQSLHSFSFADYHDPAHMGFGPLRVINEDRVAPGAGFGTHGHRDMEIISYVLDGELAHKDSIGNGSVIRPGDVQRMSAGSGVRHSEFNHARDRTTHFLQIWIEPNLTGIAPSYEEKRISDADKQGRLRLIASPDGADGSVRIHQDARLYVSRLAAGDSLAAELAVGRLGYLHLVRGALTVNGLRLDGGDAAKISDERRLSIAAAEESELLLFDLPATH